MALHDWASILTLPPPTHTAYVLLKPQDLLLSFYLCSAFSMLQVCALTISFFLNALIAHLCMSNITCHGRLSQWHFLPIKPSLNHQPAGLLSHNNLFIPLPCNSSFQLDWYPEAVLWLIHLFNWHTSFMTLVQYIIELNTQWPLLEEPVCLQHIFRKQYLCTQLVDYSYCFIPFSLSGR